MKLKGTVMNASEETRDMTGKDGNRRSTRVGHVLLSVKDGDSCEVANIRKYDLDFDLPKIGTQWETPRVRKYESYDGMVAEVML